MTLGLLRVAARLARSGLGLAGLSDRLDRLDHQLAAVRGQLPTMPSPGHAAFAYVTARLPDGPAYELSVDAFDRDEYHASVADGRLNQEQTWRFLMRWLRPGDTLFDLGANIGTFSVAAGVLGADVHAFEMLAANVTHLERAIHRNRLGRVRIVQCAVSDQRGLIGISGVSAWGSVTAGGVVAVPTLSIDDYVGLQSVPALHTIKIDIEGSELAALRGAAATLARFQPDIVLESNTFQCGTHGYSYRDCLQLLADLGYDLYRIHWGRLSPWTADRVQEIAVVDYFATMKSAEQVSGRSGWQIAPITDDDVTANVVDTVHHSDTHRRHVLAVADRLPERTRHNDQVDLLLQSWQPLTSDHEFEAMRVGNG